MTYEEFMQNPEATREDKLVATYAQGGDALTRGVFSLIDTFVHASSIVRAKLAEVFPEYDDAVTKFESGTLGIES